VASVFVCTRFYNFVAVFVYDSKNWDKPLECGGMKMTPVGADSHLWSTGCQKKWEELLIKK